LGQVAYTSILQEKLVMEVVAFQFDREGTKGVLEEVDSDKKENF